ncbi:protein kinase domain-containing protein [Streptomyces sp. NPDC055134]
MNDDYDNVDNNASPLQPLHPADPVRVGGYTLLGRLGGGGMGTVFLARSAGGRVVALKTVHEQLAREPEFRVRFRLEAEAARTIGARHGATVVDADTQGTLPWLATEYVLGPSLAEAVERYGPLPEPAVRALGARLAHALADIHGSGIVHRDLKPSNILVTATGPRIIDFGIARALGARRLTRTGQAVGTPAYMSPEQAGGRDHGPAGDLFALGGVLVFAATGHGPFPGKQAAELLYGVRHEDPDLTGMPGPLRPELARCLAKEPEERPGPAAFAERLNAPEGHFATLLPGPLLADIGRRTAGVWELRPTRLLGAPPTGQDETPPPAVPPSRRGLLLAGVGGLAALATGGVVWARHGAVTPSGPSPTKPSRPPGLVPEPLWTHRATAEVTVETVADGVVVVSVGDEKDKRSLIGLDARTGRQVWRQPRYVAFADAGAGRIVQETQSYGDPNGSPPLLLIDPRTGGLAPFPGELGMPPLYVHSVAALADGTFYLSGSEAGAETVAAYDMASGRRLWLRPTGHRERPLLGAVADDLFLYSTAMDVVGVARSDGRERWRTRLIAPKVPNLGTVDARAIADGRVFVGGTEVRALDTATGKVLWRVGRDRPVDTGFQPVYGVPVVADDVVHVIAMDAHDPGVSSGGSSSLLALRAADGRVLWEYKTRVVLLYETPPWVHQGTYYLDTGMVREPLLPVGLRTHRPPWTYRRDDAEDDRLPLEGRWGRTALRLADGRLHLSSGREVITLPLTD